MYAIQKSDMDLRKTLYQNIVLSGGSTLLKGFGDRLLSEMKKSLPKDSKIRVNSSFISRVQWKLNKFSNTTVFCLRRLRLHRNDYTQLGWEVQFWHRLILSSECGSRNVNTTRKDIKLFIAKHSEHKILLRFTIMQNNFFGLLFLRNLSYFLIHF